MTNINLFFEISIWLRLVFGVVIFGIALILLFGKRRNLDKTLFASVLLSISLWSIFGFFSDYEKNNLDLIYLWGDLDLVAILPGPLLFLWFARSFVGKKTKPLVLMVLSMPIVGIGLFSFGKNNITETSILLNDFNPYQPGVLYPIFGLVLATYSGYAFYELSKLIHTGKGRKKIQAKYILLASGVIAFLGLVFALILPFYGVINLSPLFAGSIGSVVFTAGISYALIRHRLFDLNIWLRKLMIYSLSVLPLLLAYAYVVYELQRVLISSGSISNQFGQFLFLFTAFLGIPILNKYLKRAVKAKFFGGPGEERKKAMRQLMKQRKTLSIDNLLDETGRIITSNINVHQIALYLFDPKLQTFSKKRGSDIFPIQLQTKDVAVKELIDKRKVLITEELAYLAGYIENKGESSRISSLSKSLEDHQVWVAIPLGQTNTLSAIAFLGEKDNREAYTTGDVSFIRSFQDEAGLAFDNMVMYEKALLTMGVK